ncbi:MAG: exodeoxyribonuclease I [Candidatus Saccharimonadales bacterium]
MNFFFYDLETSGRDPRNHQIMQFAGIRTDQNLEQIGEPINWVIKLNTDILPEPDAVLLTGITPQFTLENGITEAEFITKLNDQVFLPDTIFTGYNTVSFDDEFMRFTLFKNFADPYRWQWADNCSRLDIIHLARMTRALRPEGIKWPFSADGKPSNRLEEITKLNGISHQDAHDALSDVRATIALAKLIKQNAPKLFNYHLEMRSKDAAAKLLNLNSPEILVHTSPKFPQENLQTSLIYPIAVSPDSATDVLTFDLKFNPDDYSKMNQDELRATLYTKKRIVGDTRPPVKSVKLNKAPALAPLSVLKPEDYARLKLSLDEAKENLEKLLANPQFIKKISDAYFKKGDFPKPKYSEADLYGGFIGNKDAATSAMIRSLSAQEIADFKPKFTDKRLTEIFPRYKARNFPDALSSDEVADWEQYKEQKFNKPPKGALSLSEYQQILFEKSNSGSLSDKQLSLINDLAFWAEKIR